MRDALQSAIHEGDTGPVPNLPFHTSRATTTVVIPALNEEKNLPCVLTRIPQWVHEVVLVDGRSRDKTVEVAVASWPNDHIVYRERRQKGARVPLPLLERRRPGITLRLVTQAGKGKGDAIRCGVEAATGDMIVILDADGSNDPCEIPAFVGALLGGADFAKGSRFLQGGGTSDMPLYRKLGNLGFVVVVRLLFGGNYSDLCYGYNAFWSRVVPVFQFRDDGFEIETVMNVRALRHRLTIKEIPSFEYKRIYGSSRLRTFPDGWRVLKAILRETAAHYRDIVTFQRPAPPHPARVLLTDDLIGPPSE